MRTAVRKESRLLDGLGVDVLSWLAASVTCVAIAPVSRGQAAYALACPHVCVCVPVRVCACARGVCVVCGVWCVLVCIWCVCPRV